MDSSCVNDILESFVSTSISSFNHVTDGLGLPFTLQVNVTELDLFVVVGLGGRSMTGGPKAISESITINESIHMCFNGLGNARRKEGVLVGTVGDVTASETVFATAKSAWQQRRNIRCC